MREKTFKNSPKGRSEIPGRVGEYMLLDIHGKNIHGDTYGWKRTENLKVRIKDEHYTYVFKYIKIRYGKDEHGNQIGKKITLKP